MHTAASFFTGIGGLDLAAERAGFRVTHMSEIDPYARRVLRNRFPDAKLLGDIRDITATDIGQPALIFGGFPCQDISVAGHGKGIDGQRSGLWFELARIISDARPRLVVLENVPAITVRGGTTVVAQLAALGYDGVWLTLRAANVGAPHHRARWFYVGAYVDHAGRQRRQITPANQHYHPPLRPDSAQQPIQERCETVRARQSSGTRRRKRHRGLRNESRVGTIPNGLPAGLDILTHEFPAGSWLPQKAHEPPRLAPDTPSRKHRIRCLGNAVVPQQAYPIFAAAHDFLQEVPRV